jgi:hypothetical protein
VSSFHNRGTVSACPCLFKFLRYPFHLKKVPEIGKVANRFNSAWQAYCFLESSLRQRGAMQSGFQTLIHASSLFVWLSLQIPIRIFQGPGNSAQRLFKLSVPGSTRVSCNGTPNLQTSTFRRLQEQQQNVGHGDREDQSLTFQQSFGWYLLLQRPRAPF